MNHKLDHIAKNSRQMGKRCKRRQNGFYDALPPSEKAPSQRPHDYFHKLQEKLNCCGITMFAKLHLAWMLFYTAYSFTKYIVSQKK